MVVLVKPQFEAGKAEADRGQGVIRDPDVWRRVLRERLGDARRRGLRVGGLIVSPITGGSGNVEYLVHLGGADSPVEAKIDSESDVEAMVIAVVGQARALA